MKTLTKDGLSIYLFQDSEVLTVTPENISVGKPIKFIISDCNSNNSELHQGVIAPQDWVGCKYFFDGVNWTLNPNWVDPNVTEQA